MILESLLALFVEETQYETGHEYNKLRSRKLGPLKVLERINDNAYRVELPDHIKTANVFNVKYLSKFKGDNEDQDNGVESSSTWKDLMQRVFTSAIARASSSYDHGGKSLFVYLLYLGFRLFKSF